MKFKLLIISCIFCLISLGCDKTGKNPITTDTAIRTGQISYSIDTTVIPQEVTKIYGHLYSDRSDTIDLFDFSILRQEATTIKRDVPVGLWVLQVDAFNENDEIIYTGSCSTDVYDNTVTNIRLHLSRIDTNESGIINVEVTWGDLQEDFTYFLNANGYTGGLNLTIDDSQLSGNGLISTDGVTGENIRQEFDITTTHVNDSQGWKGRPIRRIQFSRSDINQTWYGWGSYNDNFYAGYFVGDESTNGKKSPWIISKVDDSILSKDSHDSSLEGRYTINANGYTGRLDIVVSNDTSFSGSGRLTRNGYTGGTRNETFDTRNGRIRHTVTWKGRRIKEITFTRSSINQTYNGWQSWDGKVLAGYFTDDGSTDGVEFGWYAVKQAAAEQNKQE